MPCAGCEADLPTVDPSGDVLSFPYNVLRRLQLTINLGFEGIECQGRGWGSKPMTLRSTTSDRGGRLKITDPIRRLVLVVRYYPP